MRNPRRLVPLLLGAALFAAALAWPLPPANLDPNGQAVPLTVEGKAALGLFLMAALWWIFEVIPMGVTAMVVGIAQSVLMVRDSRAALTDFMDPSVWFIIGSLLIGTAFTKSGLTRRIAFRVLAVIPEDTRLIYLGVFGMTAALTMVMAHTAVAAAVFPLLLVVHNLYEPGNRRTRFGKGLFIGMAWTAGAGSVITLLGAARGAVAVGFFRELTGREITFFEVSEFMLPLGAVMVLALWGWVCVAFPPERTSVPGLRRQARALHAGLPPLAPREVGTVAVVLGVVALLTLRSFVPALAPLDKSAVIMTAAVVFFLSGVLDLKDLENLPWNIVLLFGGAMSLGFCLWETGAARWLAIGWLTLFHGAHPLVFVVGVAALVLLTTNFIMNVAAIAITLPVALVMAPYVNVEPEVVMFAALAAAGMPFMLLVGAAPNAIAYESGQFTARDFFVHGIGPSVLLLLVILLFVWKIWPWMGMPVLLSG